MRKVINKKVVNNFLVSLSAGDNSNQSVDIPVEVNVENLNFCSYVMGNVSLRLGNIGGPFTEAVFFEIIDNNQLIDNEPLVLTSSTIPASSERKTASVTTDLSIITLNEGKPNLALRIRCPANPVMPESVAVRTSLTLLRGEFKAAGTIPR